MNLSKNKFLREKAINDALKLILGLQVEVLNKDSAIYRYAEEQVLMTNLQESFSEYLEDLITRAKENNS